MNIIRSLTLRHLALNRQRTLVTIIGVILSVALITTVPTFTASFLDMLRRETARDYGNWHVRYEGVTKEEAASIKEQTGPAQAAFSQDIGYARLPGSLNESKPFLFVKALDSASLETQGVTLIKGRLPENSSELVIAEHIADNGGVHYELGDVLELETGRRVAQDGQVLGQHELYQRTESGAVTERFVGEAEHRYTIIGIMARPDFEVTMAPGYSVITRLDEPTLPAGEKLDLTLTWDKVTNQAVKQANLIAKAQGLAGPEFNKDLLRFYGILGDNFLQVLYSVAAIVITLVVVASATLIFNSFAISTAQRSRQLGLLASVGATRRQKAESVLFEGAVIAFIGIPLGILLGLGGLAVTFRLIQPLLATLTNSRVELQLVVSPAVILVSFLLASVTILLSALLPALRASRISPIDAIRQAREVKLTRRRVKTSRLTRRIFGFEADLALKNLKRNKGRYRITVISLVISIVLFLTVSAITLYTAKSISMAKAVADFDVTVWAVSRVDGEAKQAFYQHLASLPEVDESVIGTSLHVQDKIASDKVTPEVRSYLQPAQDPGNLEVIYLLQAVDDATLDRYARANGVEPELLKDPAQPRGILVNQLTLMEKGKFRQVRQFDLTGGDSVHLTNYRNNPGAAGVDLTLAATADDSPINESEYKSMHEGEIVVSETVLKGLIVSLGGQENMSDSQIRIKTEEATTLVQAIKDYQRESQIGSLNIVNLEEVNARDRQFNTLVAVFFYGFVGLFAAISIANIFNTISTGVSLRRVEFAMLRSIGMTPESFNRMIRFESLFYAIKALLYGLPLSLGLMFLVYRSTSQTFQFPFILPWGSLVVTVLAVFGLVSLTMFYASARLKRENIVDALKNENI